VTAEVVFTRGTTESINLVAASLGQRLKAGDEVLITWLEHHSNIVPWQLLCERTGARLVVAPIHDDGSLDVAAFEQRLNARTKIVAVAHVSNALGTVNPVRELVAAAHAAGALVLVDGAQAVPHLRVDVQALGCDFYAFSGHKMFGPTGTGVLYGKRALLDAMPPYQGGGDMILTSAAPTTPCPTSSKPARRTSRAWSVWVRPSTICRHSTSQRSPRMSTRCS
jgi:cysteine desulfurase/selenocysteine lyase